MIEPDLPDKDAVLEYAACLIEDIGLEAFAGCMARRKRDREDAALRAQAARETRRLCAEQIRAMKSRHDLDAKTVLRRLAGLSEDHCHAMYLIDAWPLAWKGWLDIKCIIRCNDNSILPYTEYRIELTEHGHRMLAESTQNPDADDRTTALPVENIRPSADMESWRDV